MRVLLDENLAHDLAGALTGHAVSTVQGLGWAGAKNGALLRRAGDVCDVFVSMDRNIEHQQILSRLSFGVVVVDAPSNRMEDLVPSSPNCFAPSLRLHPVRSGTSASPRSAAAKVRCRSRVAARDLSVPTGTRSLI